MFTKEDIVEYVKHYRILNGEVYLEDQKEKIVDENIVLRVKASRLLYNEAKISYLEDQKQFGNISQNFDYYLLKMMERFSVHDEVNFYGANKLIRSLLASNGHYEEMMSGNDVSNSKYSIFYGEKKDYGLAYLRLKLRERGLDISDLSLKLDTSELKKNGVSKVILDYHPKKYNPAMSEVAVKHPNSDILNELEEKKRNAKEIGDADAYHYAQANIERIIKNNPISVTEEQWENMDLEQKASFMKLKIKEAQALKDSETCSYWQANLMMLPQTAPKNSSGNKKK